jgi:phage gp37-like protein
VDLPLGAPASLVALLCTIILMLVSLVIWGVRLVLVGRLVTASTLEREQRRGDLLEKANASLLEQLRELLTDKDLGVYLLRGVQARADAARDGDPR